MIVIEEQDDVVVATAHGELTATDFAEFGAAVVRELRGAPRVRLLLDLTNLTGYTLDVAWEELKFTRAHAGDFRRIALVSGSEWLPWLAWVPAAFTDAEVEIFDDRPSAEAWLSEGSE